MSNKTENVRGLLGKLDYHLATRSILAGLTPGQVYVDDPLSPKLGLAWFHSRVYIAGEIGDPERSQAVEAILRWEILPQMLEAGREGFIIDAEPAESLEHIPEMLPGIHVIPAFRHHYTCDRLVQDWRPLLPGGYELRPVEPRLLEDPNITNLDWLREEMLSERPSVDDFLEKSFGVCLVKDKELVGWCLSEYNCDGRCEVGVATAEEHQRRGLGTAMSLALVEEAFHRGLRQVGWHCWARNSASAALAKRSGFQLEREYPVVLVLLNES